MTIAVIVGAAMALPVGMATAGLAPLQVTPTFDRAVPEFDFSAEAECDPAETEYSVVSEAGDPVDVDLQVDTEGNGAAGTFRVPGLAAAFYVFVVDCGGGEVVLEGDFGFARYTVAKEVEGDVPDDARFVIDVDCVGGVGEDDEFTETLEFGPDGGSQPVVTYGPATCTVTESEDGGAEDVTIDGGEAVLDWPVDAVATVTNTFPVAEPSPTPTETVTPTETPTPTPTPTEVPAPTETPTPTPTPTPTEDEVDEADAADAIDAQPTYTG